MIAHPPTPEDHPTTMGDSHVLGGLSCGRCGYSLKGQRLEGVCPECAFSIQESLEATIDLESPRRGPLPMPRAAGIAIILVAACALLGPIITLVAGIMAEVSSNTFSETARTTLSIMEWVGGVGSAVGVVALAVLLFAAGRREFKPQWVLLLGYVCFLVGIPASLWLPYLSSAPIETVALVEALRALWLLPTLALSIALGRLIATLGRRSLRFRKAGDAVQTARPLVWTVLIQLIALGIALASTDSTGFVETAGGVATILWLVTGALAVVGFAYLLFNAIWASIPLLNASHRLAQLLDVPEN